MNFKHTCVQDMKIHLSESDVLIITSNGALCDANGEIGPMEFEDIIRSQLTLYIQVPVRGLTMSRAIQHIKLTRKFPAIPRD